MKSKYQSTVGTMAGVTARLALPRWLV